MVELRCDNCPKNRNEVCQGSFKGEHLWNGFVKLSIGGAVGTYCGGKTYPSCCGIEKKLKDLK